MNERGDAANKRAFPDRPLLGVGVVAVEDERVLLIQRQTEPLKGFWSVPGGLVELGESLRDAAAREVLEETGLEVEIGEVVEVFERIERDGARAVMYHFVIVDYLAKLKPGSTRREPLASTDAADAQWVAWDSVGAHRTSPGLLPVLEKARKLLAAGQS